MSVIPTLIYNVNICTNDVLWFIYLYFISAYIKKYNVEFTKKNVDYLYFAILLIIFLFATSVICCFIGENSLSISRREIYFNQMHMLPMLFLSILVFMYFKGINVNSKAKNIINFLAKASFAVYLIHINAVIRTYLFKNIIKLQNFYHTNPVILLCYVVLTAVCIYLVCAVIDWFRRKLIEEPIFKVTTFDNFFSKIDKKINFEEK